MRRHTLIIGVFLLTVGGAATQSQAPVYPELIPLPAGFGPEGIAVGKDSGFYVGAGLARIQLSWVRSLSVTCGPETFPNSSRPQQNRRSA